MVDMFGREAIRRTKCEFLFAPRQDILGRHVR